MMAILLKPLLAWTLLATSAPMPATAPAAPTQPVAASAPAVDAAADKLLNDLEEAGGKFTDIQADVEYVLDEAIFGSKDTYLGQVYYQRDGEGKKPTRFRVHFDTLQQATDGNVGPTVKEGTDYGFDGTCFIIRKEKVKQLTKYPLSEPGKPLEALELGKGPFPVPFGQKKEQVLKLFTAATRAPQPTDMPGTRYLLLTPRPGAAQDSQFKQIEMWVNEAGLPARIKSIDAKGQQITTVTFRKIRADAKLTDKELDVPPAGHDWDVHVESLRPGTQIKP